MARVRGTDFVLAMGDESTYGTAPGSGWRRLPVLDCDFGSMQPLQPDPILSAGLGREEAPPFWDAQDVSGGLTVPVDSIAFGHWLKMMFGTATVSGSGDPYTHTWSIAAPGTPLPSKSFEKQFSRATNTAKYLLSSGVKANTLALEFNANGTQRPSAKIGLFGRNEVGTSTSVAGTPSTVSYVPLMQRGASLALNTTDLWPITRATLNFSNGLEVIRTLNSSGLADNVDEGAFTCGGTMTVRYDGDNFYQGAINQSATNAIFTWAISANRSLSITLPRIFFERQKVGVSGPGGIEVTHAFRAVLNSAPGDTASIVLKSSVSAY